MTDRYSLRIETGARAGDVVPLTSSPFRIGRNADCSLRLVEPSVSGAHAELVLEGERVLLRDLSSTNGTRIGRLKVGEAELELGLSFTLGDVRLCLIAREEVPKPARVAPSPPATEERGKSPAPETADELELEWEEPAQPAKPSPFASKSAKTTIQPRVDSGLGDDEVLEAAAIIGADQVAKAGKRSALPLVLMLVLLAASGGAYFYWSKGSQAQSGVGKVPTVAGDLLQNRGSFETDAGWTGREDWPASFRVARSARTSGQSGLLCELAAGERAQSVSDDLRSTPLVEFTLQAKVHATGSVVGRLGLRWNPDESNPIAGEATYAWGPLVTASEAFADWSWPVVAPEGYGSMNVVLAAWAPGEESSLDDAPLLGEFQVDEVSLVAGPSQPSTVVLDEVHMAALGTPPTALVVHKIDRLLIGGLHALDRSSGQAQALKVEAEDYGARVSSVGAQAIEWVFFAAPRLVEGGVSSMGAEGYLARRLEFDADGVTDLVLGTGSDLVRIGLGRACHVQGRPDEGSFRFVITAQESSGEPLRLLIKTRFGDDFKAAVDLAADARAATADGKVGLALAKWKELLDRYPYEARDVETADAARTALLRQGFDAIQALQSKLERAQFFRLQRGFEDCGAQADLLLERYAGSELEAPLQEIAARVQTELASFPPEPDVQAGHMHALLEVLQEQGAQRLVQELQQSPQGQKE